MRKRLHIPVGLHYSLHWELFLLWSAKAMSTRPQGLLHGYWLVYLRKAVTWVPCRHH